MKVSISLVDPLNVNDPQDPEFFETTKLIAFECKNGGCVKLAMSTNTSHN